MKKITIVGRGTVGCLAVAHFLRWTNWNIDWTYDPTIEPAAVGEGTNLILPRRLGELIKFDGVHMDAIKSTPKLGVWKRNWGTGKEFYHTFPGGSIGIHFDAIALQHHMFDLLTKNRRVRTIEENTTNYEDLDSDFVLVCTGSPKSLGENEYTTRTVPVNACTVYQCPWDLSRFNYSITFAKKHGWVFGIPLQHRIAIGYVNNSDYATKEDIATELQEVLDEFGLVPAKKRELTFNNYSRKINFTKKVAYNGNASFFLEPLEAASTAFGDHVNRLAYDVWLDKLSVDEVNWFYNRTVDEMESMICLHYMAGSVYDTEFWKYAKEMGYNRIVKDFEARNDVANILYHSVNKPNEFVEYDREVGPWSLTSYHMNVTNLGLEDTIRSLTKQYGM